MRNELGPLVREETKAAFDETADDDCTHQCTHALGGGNGDGERKEGEADAHDDRQT